ncbi:hypothetical protein FRC07_000700 [Ceratobasidium sp. 392]|nr:hypothetical protein FRC07_000700 [Ceratobasidium sp. 392]
MSTESRPTVNENAGEADDTLYISERDVNKALGHIVRKHKQVEFQKLLENFEKTAQNVSSLHESSNLTKDASDNEIIQKLASSGFWTNMASLTETVLLLYAKEDEREALYQLNKGSNRAPALLSEFTASATSPTSRKTVSPKKPINTRIANHDASKPVPARRSFRLKTAPKKTTTSTPPTKPVSNQHEAATVSPKAGSKRKHGPLPSRRTEFEHKLTAEDRMELKAKRLRTRDTTPETTSSLPKLSAADPFSSSQATSIPVSASDWVDCDDTTTNDVGDIVEEIVDSATNVSGTSKKISLENKIVCDGTYSELAKRVMPRYDIQELSDKAKAKGMSIEAYCDEFGPPLISNEDLTVIDFPCTVVDCKGRVMLSNLPQFFSKRDVEIFSEALRDLRRRVHPRKNQADANGRGNPSTYAKTIPDDQEGCINWASAWVSDGHIQQDESRISGDSTGGVQRCTDFHNHLNEARLYHMLMNYGLSQIFPVLFRAHLLMRSKLQAKFPAVNAASTNNPNVMSGALYDLYNLNRLTIINIGASYIYNRHTSLHTDHREGEKGISPLVVMGNCKTGRLAVPRLGLKLDYLPGALVFLRGRLLDHEVVDWKEDGDRICLAHFNHETEWKNSGVSSQW